MRLSIITPSFNQGRFIAQTIESILNQPSGLDLEFIIVDAKSTDGTAGIVEKYRSLIEKKGIRFKFISEPDRGQSDAINKGSKLATGELLTYLNSDDYYEPNVLGEVVKAFTEFPHAQWGFGGWKFVDLEGREYISRIPMSYSKTKLLCFDTIVQPSCFYKRDFFLKSGLIDEKLHLSMDYDLWLRMSATEDPITIPFVISNARYYMETKSATKTMKHLFESFQLQKKYSKGLGIRVLQYFYLLRGIAVILFGYDISVRIEKKRQKLLHSS
ncbi:MAG: glycosyltransferase family 2 protein [Patescibacteria group bacterium]|jgi:glycosyltransferase involved in cell wall biosynthesis